MKIGFIGAGRWGKVLINHLAKKEKEIFVYEKYKRRLKFERENIKILKDLKEIEKCSLIFLTLPSYSLRELLEDLKGLKIRGKTIFVSCIKGIEEKSLKRMSEIIYEYFPYNPIAVLCGPGIPEEVSLKIPTTLVIACKNREIGEKLQKLLSFDNLRVYYQEDIIGCEIGGAIKNVIAIAAGILDGKNFGINTKAALISRGLAEIMRLGIKLGALPLTFAGLSGVGDLIVTCFSKYSRNYQLGFALGKGKKLEEILKEKKGVIEGYYTAKSIYQLKEKYNVEMPICEGIYQILFLKKDIEEVIEKLLKRSLKEEFWQ
ncbi:MAG: NAD(P)-dependent glycerol-3-phosphate dehydrogenase [candidate division WOR-3 bacterium]|nr:NAD(P)-dependent glycerol-3-phosphate dehydrogenase [candidate division WOR-3 bacterium]